MLSYTTKKMLKMKVLISATTNCTMQSSSQQPLLDGELKYVYMIL